VYQKPLSADHVLMARSLPPLIGIVTHELRAEPQPAWESGPDRSERDRNPPRLSMRLSYTQALQEAGAIAVVLPAHGDLDDIGPLLDRMDGLLFSGGPDLDPATYGHERHAMLGPDVDRLSDEYELALLREATARDLPMLAICRGMQALNVSRGGTLHQHLPGHRQIEPATATTHTVHVDPGTRLAALVGTDPLRVNSFHHQAVEELGRGLLAVARAADGIVEGIEDPGPRFVVGVQWHAEGLIGFERHRMLFEALVAAAVEPAARPLPRAA
jgi:putative glutamine amidotransferase